MSFDQHGASVLTNYTVVYRLVCSLYTVAAFLFESLL